MLEKIQYKNYKEMTNSENFKKGVQDFKEGKVKIPSHNYEWLKGTVSNRDWDNYFSYNQSYTFIKRIGGIKNSKGKVIGGKTLIAFIVATDIVGGDPRISDVEPLSDEEAMVVDEYRRANNIYPRPLVENSSNSLLTNENKKIRMEI